MSDGLPERSDLEELAEAARNFGRTPQEQAAYIEALRKAGASEAYIRSVQAYWDAREAAEAGVLGALSGAWQWLGEALGIKDPRSG